MKVVIVLRHLVSSANRNRKEAMIECAQVRTIEVLVCCLAEPLIKLAGIYR